MEIREGLDAEINTSTAFTSVFDGNLGYRQLVVCMPPNSNWKPLFDCCMSNDTGLHKMLKFSTDVLDLCEYGLVPGDSPPARRFPSAVVRRDRVRWILGDSSVEAWALGVTFARSAKKISGDAPGVSVPNAWWSRVLGDDVSKEIIRGLSFPVERNILKRSGIGLLVGSISIATAEIADQDLSISVVCSASRALSRVCMRSDLRCAIALSVGAWVVLENALKRFSGPLVTSSCPCKAISDAFQTLGYPMHRKGRGDSLKDYMGLLGQFRLPNSYSPKVFCNHSTQRAVGMPSVSPAPLMNTELPPPAPSLFSLAMPVEAVTNPTAPSLLIAHIEAATQTDFECSPSPLQQCVAPAPSEMKAVQTVSLNLPPDPSPERDFDDFFNTELKWMPLEVSMDIVLTNFQLGCNFAKENAAFWQRLDVFLSRHTNARESQCSDFNPKSFVVVMTDLLSLLKDPRIIYAAKFHIARCLKSLADALERLSSPEGAALETLKLARAELGRCAAKSNVKPFGLWWLLFLPILSIFLSFQPHKFLLGVNVGGIYAPSESSALAWVQKVRTLWDDWSDRGKLESREVLDNALALEQEGNSLLQAEGSAEKQELLSQFLSQLRALKKMVDQGKAEFPR